jgi:hypothetical protein
LIAGGTSSSRLNGTPVSVNGDYNTIEWVTAQWATGSGFNSGGSGTSNLSWPKYNRYINCTAFENKDAAGQDSDGFAAKRVGPGNEYIGCVAYDNADDGWDFFNWVDSGPSMPILIENSIAYNHPANGFKMGGETQPVNHIIRNSIAYNNTMAGYSDNFNPGHILVENCVSIDNGTQNFMFRNNPIIPPTHEIKDSVSYRTAAKRAQGQADAITGTIVNSFITDANGVSTRGGTSLNDSDFYSVDPADAYTRDASGNLIRGNFGKLR